MFLTRFYGRELDWVSHLNSSKRLGKIQLFPRLNVTTTHYLNLIL